MEVASDVTEETDELVDSSTWWDYQVDESTNSSL